MNSRAVGYAVLAILSSTICGQNQAMSDNIPPDRPPNPNFEKARVLRGPLSAQLASYDAVLCEQNPAAGAAYQGSVEHLIRIIPRSKGNTFTISAPPGHFRRWTIRN